MPPIPNRNVRLFCGDCLDVMPKLKEKSIDLVLCDPPYGTTQNKWDSIIPLQPMWACLERVIKERTALVFTASQPFTSVLGHSGLSWLRYSWVWHKSKHTGHLNVKRMPMKSVEDIIVFYAYQPTYHPQGLISCNKITIRGHNGSNYGKSGISNRQTSTNYPRTLLAFKSVGKPVHPTQKPVALMEYLIKTYTNEGNTVLDFAMGSGTTGVACKNLNRKFIGIELDKKYFEIAKERIRNAEATK